MTDQEIERIFTYQAPVGDQPARYTRLRDKAKELALLILDVTPASADQTDAIRKLRECVMTANAAIAMEHQLG